MIKRLPAALLASFLLLLGLRWVWIAPAYAPINPFTQQSLSLTSASISTNGRGIFGYEKYSYAPLILVSSPVLLDSKTPHDVAINLAGSIEVNLSEPIVLSGFLRDISTDQGIANKTIKFSTSGFYLGQTHSDDTAAFKISIKKDLPAGDYLVTASFKGAHPLDTDS